MKVTDPKSNNRRKWLIGGLAVFGGIALLTTGLSAYIIGKNVNSADNAIDVGVDTVNNKSLVLTATVSESAITLGESSVITTGVVTNDAADGDLAITFSSLKLEYGSEIGAAMPTKLVFSFKAGLEANDALAVTDNKLGTVRSGASWTYLTAPVDIPVSDFGAETSNGNTKIRELTNKTVSFAWGSFFETVSPANYYNGKFDQSTVTTEQMNSITDELKAMHTALDGKKLELTVTAE